MQSYWMTTFSCATAITAIAATASAERAIVSLRIISRASFGSELDLELAEDGGAPAGAGLERAVAPAVEVLADEVDLPARPAVEPDVGAGRDGLDAVAVDGPQGTPRDLGELGPQDGLHATLGLASPGPEGRLDVAAGELGVAVLEVGGEPLGVEREPAPLPVGVEIPAAAVPHYGQG